MSEHVVEHTVTVLVDGKTGSPGPLPVPGAVVCVLSEVSA